MATKILLFVLAAVLVLQGSSALKLPNITGISIGDQWNSIKDKIESVVNSTEQKIEELTASVKEKAQEYIENGKAAIANITAGVDEKIEELKQQAAEVGVDIKECIDELPNGGDDILQYVEKQLVSCITDTVNKGKAIVDDVIAQVKAGYAVINDTEADLEECLSAGNALLVAACKTKAIASASAKEVAISTKIAADIVKAEEFVQSITLGLEQCAASKAQEAAVAAATAIAQIGQCVADKISQATPSQ